MHIGCVFVTQIELESWTVSWTLLDYKLCSQSGESLPGYKVEMPEWSKNRLTFTSRAKQLGKVCLGNGIFAFYFCGSHFNTELCLSVRNKTEINLFIYSNVIEINVWNWEYNDKINPNDFISDIECNCIMQFAWIYFSFLLPIYFALILTIAQIYPVISFWSRFQ